MYNLDVNMATAAGAALNLLGVETGGTTPRTPEILNSLMAMTNPLDNYSFGDDAPKPAKGGCSATKPFASASSDSNSSSCSQAESPTSSVQQTCSQLIKAGLKLTIEQKRKHQSDSDDILDLDKCKRVKRNECSESEEDKTHNAGWFSNYAVPSPNAAVSDGVSRTCADWQELETYGGCYKRKLTPEDEERRRRRRERNKIAATKCRLKKREKTANLVTESEILEKQNVDLKAQIQAYQAEQRNLTAMLESHRATCRKDIPRATKDAIYSGCRLPSIAAAAAANHHSYGRPQHQHQHQVVDVVFDGPQGSADVVFARPTQYGKPPTIVVDSPTATTDVGFLPHVDQSPPQNVYHHNGNNYATQQCHNYGGAGYGSNGLDNGCMA